MPMVFDYVGDSGRGRIVDYLQGRLHSLAVSYNNGLAEACLTLIYSGHRHPRLSGSAPGGKRGNKTHVSPMGGNLHDRSSEGC